MSGRERGRRFGWQDWAKRRQAVGSYGSGMSSATNRTVADLRSLLGLALLIFDVLASQDHRDIATLGVGLCIFGMGWRFR